MKRRMTYKLFLVIGVLLLSLILSACTPSAPQETSGTTDVLENTGNSETGDGDETPDNRELTVQDLLSDWARLLEIDENSDDRQIEFTADFHLQVPSMETSPSIPVKVENEQVYLRSILYNKIQYTNTLDFVYDDGLLLWAVCLDATELLENIQKQKAWFVFETDETEDVISQKIAVCHINDTYYFLEFYQESNIICRMCVADISDGDHTGEEIPDDQELTLQDLLSDWANLLQADGNANLEFAADFCIERPGLESTAEILPIRVENEQVYFGSILYNKIQYANTIDLVYTDTMLLLAEKLDLGEVFANIHKKSGWFVFETEETQYVIAPKIAVCRINDTYYFLEFFQKNNRFDRIYIADFSDTK